MKSLGSSAVVKRDVVPEHRVCGGSNLLSLFGRERSQKGLQLVGEEPGAEENVAASPRDSSAGGFFASFNRVRYINFFIRL